MRVLLLATSLALLSGVLHRSFPDGLVETSHPIIYEPAPLGIGDRSTGRPEVSLPTPQVRVLGTSVDASTTGWTQDPEVSWYGPGFYGNRTACGHAYTTTILGVAHRNLPCGTLVEFRWKGVTATVPVIDRGPYVEGRTWDLSGGLCVYLNHCFTGPIEWRFP